jgi:hypothetical protein
MPDAQLAQHDIAAVNLACAAALPGAEASGATCGRLINGLSRWRAKLRAVLPPVFPLLDVEFAGRRYPALPFQLERDILALEAIEKCVPDPVYSKPFREPQARCPDQRSPTRIPMRLVVRLAH